MGEGRVRVAPALARPARPEVKERQTYVPLHPQEAFIVPLLKEKIEQCITQYAEPAIGSRKALDMGCGGQPFRALLERAKYSYCGADANPQGVEVDFRCALDEELPTELLRRGPFDFVLCTEVLEHVADWRTAFENFGLLLAPGGRALITTPFFYPLHEEPYDFWRPTLHAVDYYARLAGLGIAYRQAAGDVCDVLGTTLGCCKFTATSRRLTDRSLAKVVRIVSRAALRALRSPGFRRRVQTEGPLYLSSVAVLERSERS